MSRAGRTAAEMPLLHRRPSRSSARFSRVIASAVLAAIALIAPSAALAQAGGLKEGTERWYLERGKSNMEIGNYKAAIEAYQKATQLNPNNREAMKQLGVAYEKQGLTTDAIKQFDRYLERFKDDADIAFKQADYLGWSRFAYRREDAIKYYRMGLAVREDDERRHKLAQLLGRDRKQLDEAIGEYRKLLKSKPNKAEWRAEYLKLLVWDDKHLDEAIREYRRLAEQKKGDFETDRALASLLARKDPKSQEVRKRYADLVKRKPKDEALRREYSDLLSGNTGNRSQAIEEYRKLVASDPSPETRYKFAKLLAQDRSHLDEAIGEYRKLLEAQPDNAQWREEYRKLLLWEGGHLGEAIKEQRRVVAANPDDFEAKRTLAQLVARNDPTSEEARTLYADLLRRRPNDGELRREYADLLSGDAINREAAIEEYRALLDRDRQPATRHKLARMLAGDPTHRDEAVEQYRTLIETDPGNPEWRDEYRQLLLSNERYRGDAIAEYRRLVNERPGDVEAKHTLARLLAGEDPKSKEALATYADLVKRRPGRRRGASRSMQTCWRADASRRADAIEQYKALVKSDPDRRRASSSRACWPSDRAQVGRGDRALPDPDQEPGEGKARESGMAHGIPQGVALGREEHQGGDRGVPALCRREAGRLRGAPHAREAARARRSAQRGGRQAVQRPREGAAPTTTSSGSSTCTSCPPIPNGAPGDRQYRTLVEAKPTPELREALADLLAARPEGRDEAQEQYEAILREKPMIPKCASSTRTCSRANARTPRWPSRSTRAIVRDDPKNAAAHMGLARGYAALRQRNKALREANLALEYGAKEKEVAALRKDLLRGREPNVEVLCTGSSSAENPNRSSMAWRLGVGGRADARNGDDAAWRVGGEDYWSGGQEAAGGFARADTDFHLELRGRHRARRRIPHARRAQHRRARGVLLRRRAWLFGLGANRSLRYDSYVAVAGDRITGREIGSARENRLHLMWGYEGERATLTFTALRRLRRCEEGHGESVRRWAGRVPVQGLQRGSRPGLPDLRGRGVPLPLQRVRCRPGTRWNAASRRGAARRLLQPAAVRIRRGGPRDRGAARRERVPRPRGRAVGPVRGRAALGLRRRRLGGQGKLEFVYFLHPRGPLVDRRGSEVVRLGLHARPGDDEARVRVLSRRRRRDRPSGSCDLRS